MQIYIKFPSYKPVEIKNLIDFLPEEPTTWKIKADIRSILFCVL